ncbi:MAG: hypothetical protein M9928_19930 [Anaerolineae bacterium]|nr:hypothetical protein [Anaerolineae bacterium]
MARKYTARVRTQLRQAQRVERNNKLSAAEGLYREILQENPEVAEAWVGLGNVTKDSAEKEMAYRKCLEIDPDNNVARRALGMEPVATKAEPPPKAEPASEPATVNTKTSKAAVTPNKVKESRTTSAGAAAVAATQSTAPTSDKQPPAVQTKQPEAAETTQKTTRPEKFEVVSPNQATADVATVDADTVDEILFCKNHADRETTLRCYRCNEPICMSCAKRTSVGYLCPQCVYEAEEKFFSATKLDYIIGGAIALVLSGIAAWFASILGFWVIFVAAAVGTLIGTATFYAVGRRRGRYLPQTVAAMVVVGVAPAILGSLVFSLGSFSAVWLIVYVVLATSSAYYRMRY